MVSFLTTSFAARVQFPISEIWRYVFSGFHQNLDPVDRDSESRRSVSCGILLFPPTARWSSPCQVFHPVHHFWMVPPLWMVSQRYGPLSSCTFALGEVPRLYHNTPGQTLMPYRTNFVRKDSGCWWIRRIHISRFLTLGIESEPRIS